MLDLKKWMAKVSALCNMPLTYVTLAKSVPITAGTTSEIIFSNVAPSGYKMVGINSFSLGGTYPEYIALNSWVVSNSNNTFSIRLRALTSSSTVSVDLTCYVLCLKESLYNVGGGTA